MWRQEPKWLPGKLEPNKVGERCVPFISSVKWTTCPQSALVNAICPRFLIECASKHC